MTDDFDQYYGFEVHYLSSNDSWVCFQYYDVITGMDFSFPDAYVEEAYVYDRVSSGDFEDFP